MDPVHPDPPCSHLPFFPTLHCLILLFPLGCTRNSSAAGRCKRFGIDGCSGSCSSPPARRDVLGLSRRRCFTAVCSASSPRARLCVYAWAAGSCDRQRHKGCLSCTPHVEAVSGISVNAPDVGCREHSDLISEDDIFITFQHQLLE